MGGRWQQVLLACGETLSCSCCPCCCAIRWSGDKAYAAVLAGTLTESTQLQLWFGAWWDLMKLMRLDPKDLKNQKWHLFSLPSGCSWSWQHVLMTWRACGTSCPAARRIARDCKVDLLLQVQPWMAKARLCDTISDMWMFMCVSPCFVMHILYVYVYIL